MIKLGSQSFFLKIIIGLVVVLVLLGIANLVQTRAMMYSLFSEQQEKQGLSVAQTLAGLAGNLIVVNNYYELHELIKHTPANYSDVRYSFVVSAGGEVLAHSFVDGFPRELLTANTPSAPEPYHVAVLSTEEGIIRDIAVPLFEGRVGVLHIGMSDASLQAVLQETTKQLLLDTVLAVFISIALVVVMARSLTQPVRELVSVADSIKAGDLTRRAKVSSGDEFSQLAVTFNSMADHLYELLSELKRKEEARTQLLQKVIVAQEEERKRIARELHDETGQTLTSLMVGLKCVADSCPAESRYCQPDDMRALIKQTLGEIHQLAVELRPSVLDDMGLVAALEKYMTHYRENYGLDADLHVEWQGQERVSHEIEVTVYRIVQEALTNVVKYAHAQNVSVIVTRSNWGLEVIVEDDGIGFIPAKPRQDNSLQDGSKRPLSEQEKSVLRLIAMGYSNVEIGGKLLISTKTVETYKYRVMEKLNAKKRSDLVKYALESGLINREDGKLYKGD